MTYRIFSVVLTIFFVSRAHGQSEPDTAAILRYLDANREQLHLSGNQSPALFDNAFYSKDIYLFGESHGSAEPHLADLYLFKSLYRSAGVRTYVAEVDVTKAWMLNNYMRDGNEGWLRKVFASWVRDTAQWASQENFDKYRSLHQFYVSLPAEEKFSIVGVDITQDYSLLKEQFHWILAQAKPVNGNVYQDSLKKIFDTITYAGRRSLGSFSRRLLEAMSTNTRIAGTSGKNHRQFVQLITSLSFIAPGVTRDSIMYQNFREAVVSENLAGKKIYGFLGLFHCLTTGYNGARTFADLLQNDEESLYQGRVSSMIMQSVESKTMIPMLAELKSMMPASMISKSLQASPGYGGGRYLALDMGNDQPMMMTRGIEFLKSGSNKNAVTLFRLTGQGSPYSASKLSAEISGIQSLRMNNKDGVTTAAMQYIILFRNSNPATPLIF